MDVYRCARFLVDNLWVETIIPLGFLGEEDIISIQSGIFGGLNEAETDEEEKEERLLDAIRKKQEQESLPKECEG